MVLGAAINGFSISTMLTPNKIVCGGVAGIATILYQTFNTAPGLTIAVINVLLLLLGMKFLGKDFIVKTVFCVGLNSCFV